MKLEHGVLALITLSLGSVACSSSPAAPFNTLPNSQATALRLQNYEPPAAVGATPSGAAVPTIPGLPPEITAWMNQGAKSVPQLIPPNLLPPGLIPGLGGAVPGVAPPDTTPRFHNFRVLGSAPVGDESAREKIAKILGDKDSFESGGPTCMYPEMGLTWNGNGAQNDVLISFSCRQVAGFNFPWPHGGTNLKPDAIKGLTEVATKIFPQ